MGNTTLRVVAAVVVLAVVTSAAVGVVSSQAMDSYTVRQDDRCFAITPLSGDESVKEFYGYESTIEGNPYTVAPGPGFSSERTLDLQAAEMSLLFLYKSPDGNLSLVMIHGAREEGVDGGAASFDVSGLPEDGRWTVKDDEYDSPNNTDRWRHGRTTAEIDWAWSSGATDGGAYEGLGDEFNVTVEPGFNGEAALFGQVTWGTVEDWQALSGDRANPNRTSLDIEETVTISTEPCGSAAVTTEDRGGGAAAGGGDDDAERGGADSDDWPMNDRISRSYHLNEQPGGSPSEIHAVGSTH